MVYYSVRCGPQHQQVQVHRAPLIVPQINFYFVTKRSKFKEFPRSIPSISVGNTLEVFQFQFLQNVPSIPHSQVNSHDTRIFI